MNKIFKVVWNAARNCWVAVNEVASFAQNRGGRVRSSVKRLTRIINCLILLNSSGYAYSQSIGSDTVISSYESYDSYTVGVDSKDTIFVYQDTYFADKWTENEASEDSKRAADEYIKTHGVNVTINAGGSLVAKNMNIRQSAMKVFLYCGWQDLWHDGVQSVSWQVSSEGKAPAKFLNNGGSLRADSLNVESQLIQTSGSSNIGSITGGGSVNLSGGTMTFGTLSSGANITATGGTIVANSIKLTSKTLTASNTTLKTSISNVGHAGSYNETVNGLLMDALSADSSRTLEAGTLGSHSYMSGLNSDFVNNVSWSGGAFVFSDYVTDSVASSMRSQIRNAFGSDVAVSFGGVYSDKPPVDTSNGLTASLANAILSENGITTGAIFSGKAIDLRSDNLTVGGNSSYNITTSVGFESLNGSGTVTATGGKEFALLGNDGVLAAENQLIADGGIIRLGSLNRSYSKGGSVPNIVLLNNGTARTAGGAFTIETLEGAGNLDVASGTTTVNAFNIEGTVTNAGTLNFVQKDVAINGGSNTNVLNTQNTTFGKDFSNDRGTWNLSGQLAFADNATVTNGTGRINTVFGNLFDNGTGAEIDPINTIGVNAVKEEAVATFTEEWFTKYIPGTVKDAVRDHMTFDGKGHVYITDAELTTTQRDDLTNAFAAVFGDTTKLHFDGKIEGISTNSVLNMEMVNKLADAGHVGIVYFDRNLEGEQKDVMFGNGGLNDSVGFMGITEAANVTIGDQKKMVLVGKKGDSTFEIVDSAQPVSIVNGATLQLGSLGLKDAGKYQGHIEAVTADGKSVINAAAGDYAISTLELRDARTQIDDGAKLSVTETLSGVKNAELVNSGDLTAKNVDFAGRFTNEAGTIALTGNLLAKGEIANRTGSTMTVAGDADISGTFTNEALSTRAAEPNLRIDGATTVTGTFTNAGHALLADATVEKTLTNQAAGHLVTEKLLVNGTLANSGLIDARNSSEVHGTLTNGGTINLWDSTIASGGTLTNTGKGHTIAGRGTIQVNGLLENIEGAKFTGEALSVGSVTRAAEYGTVTNDASMTLQAVNVVNGTFNNNGTLLLTKSGTTGSRAAGEGKLTVSAGSEFFNHGSLQAENIVVEAGGYMDIYATDGGITTFAARAETPDQRAREITIGGTTGNKGITHYGKATIAGTGVYTTAEGGITRFGISDTWPNGEGLFVEAGGKVYSLGDTYVTRKLDNKGTISGSGELFIGTSGYGDDSFTNSGEINVANIVFTKAAPTDALTLTNTGTINAASGFTADGMTYKQTAENASLTAKGGWFTNSNITIEAGGITHDGLGTGNTYVLGKEGLTGRVVSADLGTITSDSEVTVLEGATLNGRDIQLTAAGKTLHLLGGRMETTLDQLFGDISYKALDLDATDRDDLVDVEGVKIATGVGTLKSSIQQGVEFGWGTVAFDDAVYSASVAGDVLAKLDANDGPVTGHEADLEVAFNGKSDQYFTVDLANQVKARPSGQDDQPWGSAYAVFSGETLTNTTSAKGDGGGKLLIGTNDAYDGNVLKTSIGFAAIKGVGSGVRVENRQLVLTGNAQSDADIDMLDGDLAVGAKGLVTLGSYGTDTARKGTLQNVSVEADGALRARNGSYTAGNIANAGLLLVGGDGQLHSGISTKEDAATALTAASYESARGGELLNWGTVKLGAMTTAADANAGGTVTNRGSFTVTGDAAMANVFTNLKTAVFNTLSQDGQVFTNGAEPADADDAVNQGVTLTANDLSVRENGRFINWAFAKAKTGTIDGSWANEKGATAKYDDMTVTANANVRNSGTLKAQSYAQTGGTALNSADGEFAVTGTKASTIAGKFTNEGAMTLTGANGLTLEAGADFINQGAGRFTVAPAVTVNGGRFTQNSSEAASLGALQIAGVGLVDVRTGRVINGSGELSINTTDAAQNALTNAGTVNFASATITSGKVTGNGTFESENLVIAANGDVEQQKVSAGTVTNDGRLAAHDLAVTTKADNNASGTIEVHDKLAGNIVNAGTLLFTDGDTADHDPGTLHFVSGTVTNTAKLTASEKVSVEGGHLIQNSDTAASFTDVAISEGDFRVNAGKASNLSGALNVALADKTQTAVANLGTLTFKTTDIASGMVTGDGTFGAIDADITIGADGTVDQTTVEANTLANAGSLTADALKVHESGTNTGTLTAIAAEIGKIFTNAAEGVMNLATSFTGGTLTNLGALNIKDGNGFSIHSGTIENQGVLTATEKVTLAGGNLHQSSQTEAKFTDVMVNDGLFTVDADTSANGTGSLVISVADKTASGLVNNGTTTFANADITSGKVTGSGIFGSLASSITVAVNGAIEQAKTIAGVLTNAGSITGSVEVKGGSNTGTITAGDFTAHGKTSFTNTGVISSSGSAAVNGLVNENEAHFNQGASFSGDNVTQGSGVTTITGGVFTIADGKTAVTGNGSLTADAETSVSGTLELNSANASVDLTNGTTIADKGVVSNVAGNLTLDDLTIAAGGLLSTSGTTEVGSVTAGSTGSIVMNDGKLHFGSLADASNLTFTQTAGDVGSVSADRGWFKDSVLNFEGGKFDASVIRTDKGEADGHLGHNTVNIGKNNLAPVVGPDSELPSGEKTGWKDGYVVVKVNELLSDTKVNIHSGGVLDVEALNLTPAEGSEATVVVGKGGGMQTSLEELFNDVTTSAIDIHAKDAETGLVYIVTDVLATNRVGDVKENIAAGLKFENQSMIAFDDPDWSIDLVQSVKDSMLKAGLTSDTVGVQTHYLGDFQGLFTYDTAKELFAEQKQNGTTKPVLDPGVVFDTTTFYNVVDGESADKAPGKLVIAQNAAEDGSNTITGSIGFKEVKNTNDITVADGKEFVLVGGVRPEGFNWQTGYDDSNRLMVDADDGGAVHVTDGTLTLGSWGVSSSTAGWINSADLSKTSSLVTKNGEFAVWQIANNGGTVSVTEGSILHTKNVDNAAGSNVLVAGGITVEETYDNTGSHLELGQGASTTINAYVSDKDSSITSDGTLVLENAAELNGTHEFTKNSQFTVKTDTVLAGSIENAGKAWYQDLTVSAGSSNTNSGYEKGEDLSIEEGASHVNTGTSIWNTADVKGSMTNGEAIRNGIYGDSDEFDADNAAKLQIGTDAANESFNIAGDFTNHGILDASRIESTTVTGSALNDGRAQYQDMTIGETASSTNNGYEKGENLTVEGSHVNTGTSIWNTVDVKQGGSMTSGEAIPEGDKKGNEEGFKPSATTQIGTDDKGEVFNVEGDVTNHGDLDAKKTETTLVAGTGSVTNDGRAWYDDMTIKLDGSSDNSGYEEGDILTVEGAHSNTGTSIWNNADIKEGGSMTNGTAPGDNDRKGHEEGFKSTGTTKVGSDAENETFKVAGDLTNHGVLDASKAETTDVRGTVTNDGQAFYDDMNVRENASSKNDGYEQGDILTVEGEHSNTGVSIWNNITVAQGGNASNEKDASQKTGSDAADEKNVIEGEYVNKGNLDSKDTETTEVTGGSSRNEGHAEYDDMTIKNGGESKNSGYEKGDILTVDKDGTHTNTGTSIWNNIDVEKGGSATNSKDGNQTTGTDKTDEKNVIKGDYTNEGNLDSKKTETTEIDGGTSTNKGHAEYDDMDITNGGKSHNSGYEKGDILTVDKDSTHENSGESHWNNIVVDGSEVNTGRIDAGKINVGEDGKLDNQGEISTGEFVVDGGVIDIGSGRIDAGKTEVNGGDIIIGNRDDLSKDNRVNYDTTFDKDVNGSFWVIGNGDFSIGKDAGGYADKIGAPDIPDVASRITITEKVTVGEKGSIAVGSEGWTSESDHKDLGNGDLWFGKDSVTVVDSSILSPDGSGTVFESASGTGKVTVEKGAQIVLGGLEIAGDYTITSGFNTSGNLGDDGSWLGGWTTGSIWAPADAGSGLEWVLSLGWDETKLWVHAVMEDVLNKYPDIVLPNNINDSLENCRGAEGADQVLACTVIRDKTLTAEEKTRILNSVAQIGTAAGAMNAAMNAANQASDSLEGRLSMAGEGFEKDGSMKTFEKRKALWVDALGGWSESDSFSGSSDMQIGWDSDSYGFIMGADNRFEKQDVILGAAFSYQTGSSDSVGSDFLATKNDFSTFGLHAYAGWKPSPRTNVMGTISYLKSSSEASMALPIGFSKAEADIDTNLFALGIRGEAVFEKGVVSIIPHAGVRAVMATGSDYDTKLDGNAAYKNETDSSVMFQTPIGVSLRFDHLTQSGWTIRPTADVTVMPQFGDTEQKTTVKGTSGAGDEVTGEFAGSFVATGTVGLQVENQKGFAAGFKFGYSGGQGGQKDMNVKLELRKAF